MVYHDTTVLPQFTAVRLIGFVPSLGERDITMLANNSVVRECNFVDHSVRLLQHGAQWFDASGVHSL